jgi:hypothetical protein
VTVTSTQYRRAIRIYADNAAVARDVTLPAVKRMIVLEADSGNAASVSFKVGSASIVMAAGERVVAFTDGTANGLVQLTVAASALAFDPQLWIPGKPDAGAVVLNMNARRAFSIPTNMTGSAVGATTAATGSSVFTFKKNGSSFGTATFAAAGTVATLSVTATTFAIGDIFSIEAPGSQDATLEGVRLNFAFTRT